MVDDLEIKNFRSVKMKKLNNYEKLEKESIKIKIYYILDLIIFVIIEKLFSISDSKKVKSFYYENLIISRKIYI